MKLEKNPIDLTVVGGGLAGLAGGLRAAELGKRVLILEQGADPRYPCNTRYSGGVFHIAYNNPHGPAHTLLEIIISATRGEVDRVIAQSIANNSARTLDWLKKNGTKFIRGPLSWQRFITAPPRPLKAGLDWPGYGPDLLVRNLTQKFKVAGGIIALGHKAIELICSNGKCKGLIARDRNGKTHAILSENVLLADGGFQNNPELLRRYITPNPELLIQRSAGTAYGDGIRMAEAAGAQLSDMRRFYGHLLSRDGLENPDLTPYPQLDQISSAAIVVDGEGSRFLNEGLGGIYIANKIARFENPTLAFTIFDRTIWNEGPGVKSIYPANPTVEIAGGTVFRAENITILAENIGAIPSTLKTSVENYNSIIRSGNRENSSLSKLDGTGLATAIETPPFMAIPIAVGITATMGGILVGANMQVRNKNGGLIPGLFGAGGTTGGLEGGGTLGYIGGLIKAATMGLLAGEAVSQT